ncbi:preATP grasp domain-containing protein [Nocardiopsis alba]|uniref:preATP grasp domain-containing protein n=1 Tax=Nocardiopsis alba TaxID=53437 RepID=UPI0035D9EA1A
MQNFTDRLRIAVGGSADTRLVFLGNFEVEDEWAKGEQGLPRFGFASNTAVVNRMDEFTLLLAGPEDHVILKENPDPGHLEHLEELEFDLPRILTVRDNDPGRTVTGDALVDRGSWAALSRLAEEGALLLPHGTSVVEEELAVSAGIPLAAPKADLCKALNSKIYSRRAADELGLRQVRGFTAENVAELGEAVERGAEILASGSPVVVKDAFGVSGKGIVVVREVEKLDRLRRMVERKAERSENPRVSILVEEWIEKRCDLNYQFTVGVDGSHRFDFVKEALTESGVHKGHRSPAEIDDRHMESLLAAADAIGGRMAAEGFFGVVGVDAMVGGDGHLYPVIEINARSNMSTYQVRAHETFMRPGQVSLARQYPLRLAEPLAYDRLRGVLSDLMLAERGGSGLLVNNFATVNAASGLSEGDVFEGRLYGLLLAGDRRDLSELDERIVDRLATISMGESR